MADISVILQLDDTQFSGKLKTSETALKALGSAGTSTSSQIENGFRNMSSGLDGLNSKLNVFGTLLAGAGIAHFIGDLLNSAQNLKDMAGAADISIARMLEMGTAATTAGTNMAGFAGMITKMEANMDGAVQGNVKLQLAFKDLGIGLNEIKNNAPDQNFNLIAAALAKIEDPTRRAALATEAFGKQGKMVDWKGYTEQIERLYGTMENFGASQERAANLVDKLQIQMTLVKGAVLELLSPVLGIIEPTNNMGKAMDRAKVYAEVLVGTLALIAAGTIANAFIQISVAVKELARMMGIGTGATLAEAAALKTNTAELIKNLDIQIILAPAKGRVASATTAIAIAERNLSAARASGDAEAILKNEQALERLRTRLATATTVLAEKEAALGIERTASDVAGAAGGMATLAVETENVATKVGFLGAMFGALMAPFRAIAAGIAAVFAPEILGVIAAMAIAVAAVTVVWRAFGDQITTIAKWIWDKLVAAFNAVNDAIDWMANGLRKLAGLPAIEVKAKVTGNMGSVQNATNVPSLLTNSKGEKKTLADYPDSDAVRNYNKTVLDTVAAYTLKNQEQAKGLEIQMAMVNMSAQDKEITQALVAAEKDYVSTISGLMEKERALQDQRFNGTAEQAENARRELKIVDQAILDVSAAYEKQLPIMDELVRKNHQMTLDTQTRKDIEKFGLQQQQQSKADLLKVQNDIEKLTMTTSQKRNRDIVDNARAAAQAEIDRLNAMRAANGEQALSIEQEQKIIDEALAGTQAIIGAQQELYDKSRSWSTGWAQAFNDYVENATNAAETARNVFQKATQGMEDAIVNFAKTGKFEWKSFLSSIVEELLRAQVRQLIAKTFGGLGGASSGGNGGGGGLLGMGGLFGFLASGGPAQANQPYVVGEQGPELFIPSQSGSIIPNTQLNSSGTATNVTYNISAVDALSFKQMVARDPAFMYAVTQQGALSMPMTRR
jgi:lambda family phage tail tape measure protein